MIGRGIGRRSCALRKGILSLKCVAVKIRVICPPVDVYMCVYTYFYKYSINTPSVVLSSMGQVLRVACVGVCLR